MNSILFLPILAGIGVSFLAAPVGIMMVWRRQSFLADVVAHVSLLAAVIANIFNFSITASVVLTSVFVSIAARMQYHSLPREGWLVFLSATGVSIALLLGSMLDVPSHVYQQVLFGDISLVTLQDIFWILGGGLLIIANLFAFWNPLLLMSVHKDLAYVDGIPSKFLEIALQLIIGVSVALILKVTGVLLAAAVMVMPSVSVREISNSPEQMTIFAFVFTFLSMCLGIWAAFIYDLPISSTIIVIMAIKFVSLRFVSYFYGRYAGL